MSRRLITLAYEQKTGYTEMKIIAMELTSQNIVELVVDSENIWQKHNVQWQIGYMTEVSDLEPVKRQGKTCYRPVGNKLMEDSRGFVEYILNCKSTYPGRIYHNARVQYGIVQVSKVIDFVENRGGSSMRVELIGLEEEKSLKIKDQKWTQYWSSIASDTEKFQEKKESYLSYMNARDRKIYMILKREEDISCIGILIEEK